MMELLRQGVAAFPELVEQLESGRLPQANIGALIAWAYTFAGTRDQGKRGSINANDTGMVPVFKPGNAASTAQSRKSSATNITAIEALDPGLHDIFSKEVAGHLAAIRQYINDCSVLPPPYAVTETLHRACHTLSGASKTAGVRQSIKVAEPLNHYIRKLYDNAAPLPEAGLSVLNDSVAAIEHVLAHVNEDSVFFKSQNSLVMRIQKLEQQLDTELTRRELSVDSTNMMNTAAMSARFSTGESHGTASGHYTMIDLPGDVPGASQTITENDVLAVHDDQEEDENWLSLTVDDLQKIVESPIETILRKGPILMR